MKETQFIEGYEVNSSVWIGDKRIIFTAHFVTLPFFFICGYAVRCREQDRERTKM